MFWKNLDDWEYSKVKKYWIIFELVYYVFAVVVPVIIVACNYTLWESASGVKLTPIGIIIAIILGITFFRSTKKVIKQIPVDSYKNRVMRFSCEMVYEIVLPVFLLGCLYSLKRSFETSYNVLWWCCISYIGAIVIDNLFTKHLESLRNDYKEARHLKRIQALADKV